MPVGMCHKCKRKIGNAEHRVFLTYPAYQYEICTDCAKVLRDWLWNDEKEVKPCHRRER